MRFLVRLRKDAKVSASDRRRLTMEAYVAVRSLGADIGNLRVSSSAVELDLLLDSETKVQSAIKALEGKIGSLLTLRKLDVESPPIEKEKAVKLGVDLFNEERYWESHEALESAWRKSSGLETEILQGIILLAAALVHLQKNETDVALSVMRRACGKLSNYERDFFGIDMAALKEKVKGILSTDRPDFFQIEMKH